MIKCYCRWVAGVNFSPGLSMDILKFIQLNHTMDSEVERVCMLGFDEMAISQNISYCPSQDQIFGPHKKVQVLSVRGILSSWKYPIFYNFDTKISKELLHSVITALHNHDLLVKGKKRMIKLPVSEDITLIRSPARSNI